MDSMKDEIGYLEGRCIYDMVVVADIVVDVYVQADVCLQPTDNLGALASLLLRSGASVIIVYCTLKSGCG